MFNANLVIQLTRSPFAERRSDICRLLKCAHDLSHSRNPFRFSIKQVFERDRGASIKPNVPIPRIVGTVLDVGTGDKADDIFHVGSTDGSADLGITAGCAPNLDVTVHSDLSEIEGTAARDISVNDEGSL